MSTKSPLERAIYKKLTDDLNVGAAVSTRISPLVLDQELTLPAITYDISTSRPYSDLSGASRLISLDMDFLCMADTFLAASDLGEDVRKALSGFRGSVVIPLAGGLSGTVQILGCTHTNDRTDYAAPVDGGRQGSYIRMLSFLISYRANATG